MINILIQPQELRSKATALKESAARIQATMTDLDVVLNGLGDGVFAGLRAQDLRNRYQMQRERLSGLHRMISVFAEKLESAAVAFEQADRQAFSGGAKVEDFSSTGFLDVLRRLKNLQAERDALMNQKHLTQQDLQRLHDLDRQIEQTLGDLRSQKAQIEAQLRDWRNRVLPADGTLQWGFDDGMIDAPWRTKSDQLEDELAKLNEQIGTLERQQLEVHGQIAQKEAELQQIDQQLRVNDANQQGAEERIHQLQQQYDGQNPAPGTMLGQQARPNIPPLTGDPSLRDRRLYDAILNQFAVDKNGRYLPANGKTYCNIFVWDATRAMGAEIPHWVDANGNPAGVGATGAHELSANGVVSWLSQHGGRNGWRVVSAAEAQQWANAGKPSVVTFENPGGIGHVAMVRPGELTDRGPAIAQAGAHNFNSGHVKDSFSNKPVVYWVHD